MEQWKQAVAEVGLELHMGKTTTLTNAQGRKQSDATSVVIGGDHVAILTPTESTKYLGIALASTTAMTRKSSTLMLQGGESSQFTNQNCVIGELH